MFKELFFAPEMSGSTFLYLVAFLCKETNSSWFCPFYKGILLLLLFFILLLFYSLTKDKTQRQAVAVRCHLVLSGGRVAYNIFQSKRSCLSGIWLNLADIVGGEAM